MKTCKAKTIDLLREIKDVCGKADIRYYISGELARFERRHQECEDYFVNGCIAVFAEDVKLLTQLLEQIPDRKVESLANNSSFPGFYARYMDTSTTLISISEAAYTYDTNSVGINIEIICGNRKDTFKRKVLNRLKTMWVEQNRPRHAVKRPVKKGLSDRLTAAMFRLASHTPVMKKLYSAWIGAGAKKTKVYELATTRGDILEFRAGMFAKTASTEMLGEEFCMVENIRGFADAYFERHKIPRAEKHDVFDLDVPWEQYAAVIRRNNIQLNEYQKHYQKYLDWRIVDYLPKYRKRDKFYNYMFCAEDRMLQYRAFDPEQKQQVMKLYAEKEYEQLAVLLEEYISKIEEYAGYGIGFCSDAEIFRAAISVMMYRAYNKSAYLPDFKKASNRLINIVKMTNYRHFDSVENVFWGKREKESVLKARKTDIRSSVVQEAKGYYEKYRTGER